MFELPSMISDVGCTATYEPANGGESAGVWDEILSDHEMVIQRSTSTGASFHLWRKASLAINACNRMRLVLESTRPVNQETTNQTVTEIKSLFSSPPFDSASPFERRCRWIGKSLMPAFCVPRHCRTQSGKLRIILETVHPLEPEINPTQVANEVATLISSTTCNTGLGEPENPEFLCPIPGPGYEEYKEWLRELLSTMPQEDALYPTEHAEVALEGSSNSATGFMPNVDDAAQSGVNFPSMHDITKPVHLQHIPVEVAQYSPVNVFATTPYQTASEITSICEGDHDVMGGGRPDQERRQNPDADRQCPEWTGLISDLKNKITNEITVIAEASDRSKLQTLQPDATNAASKLSHTVLKFKYNLRNFFEDVRKLVEKVSNAGQQHFLKLIALIKRFEEGPLAALTQETDGVSRKLKKLGNDLDYRQLSAARIALQCAAALDILVESFLKEQGSNFIPVARFRK